MIINCYVLAADPSWLEPSIMSYYHIVNKIVVCYDREGRAWTDGLTIPVQECVDRLLAIDIHKKITLLPGDFARPESSPMDNDSHQRRTAFAAASVGCDWVLQIDTDEVVPNPNALAEVLSGVPADADGVEWPMRPIFKQISRRWFLEVCRPLWSQLSEYPGCVAARSRASLETCRTVAGKKWRVEVKTNKYRKHDYLISNDDAIIHFSWARTASDMRRKLSSWSHSRDFDGIRYMNRVWAGAKYRWPILRDFHPIYRGLWPALKPVRLRQNITMNYRTDI